MYKKKLSSPWNYLIGLFAFVAISFACNNSDRSENSTTTDTLNTSNSNTGMAPVNTDTTTNKNVDTSMTKATNTSKTTASVKKKRAKFTSSVEPENKSLKVQVDKSGVYETTEVRPSFPGGQSAIDDYINSNFEYPDNAVDNNTEGKIILQFTVNENGKVSNAKVIGRKAGDGLDEEAERVISRMPKWNPGTVKGKPVKTNVVIPLTFRVEE